MVQTPHPGSGTRQGLAVAARISVLSQEAWRQKYPMQLQPPFCTGEVQLKSPWVRLHCHDVSAVGSPVNNFIQSLLPYNNCERSCFSGSGRDLNSLHAPMCVLPFYFISKYKANRGITEERFCHLISTVTACQLHHCLTGHKHNITQKSSPICMDSRQVHWKSFNFVSE